MIVEWIKKDHNVRQSYPTDLSDEQWQLVSSYLPQNEKVGRPRSITYREIVNAICYIASANCSWRMLPHDFPHWKTVYGYYNNWRKEGTLHILEEKLGIKLEQ
jgi:putative transposase